MTKNAVAGLFLCTIRAVLWIGLAGSWQGPLTAAPTPDAPCVVLTAQGKVEVAPRGTTRWQPVQPNQALVTGDQIRTGIRSTATLRWSDLTVIRVDELTRVVVDPPDQASGKPVLNQESGKTYLFNRESPGTIRFRTPVASGAILGTEFHLAVAENGRTELALLDGQVDLRADQQTLQVGSRELVVAEPGAPLKKTPLLNAINIIQWVLYYPAVVDPKEAGLSQMETEALRDVLETYRAGDLLSAAEQYPAGRAPATDAEKVMRAALLVGAGQIGEAERLLSTAPRTSAPGRALSELIAAVQHEETTSTDAPTTGSQWLARSYYLQSRADLEGALAAARKATELSDDFGPAWVRLAELEFGFGNVERAREALEKGLTLSPQYAPAHALSGFLLSARGDYAAAQGAFERAIELDGGLGDAWLGRGLIRIRRGDEAGGREDLQVAATLEPQRSLLRSYLGKAFSEAKDNARAEKELALAKELDPNDPTPWLYSALVLQEENRVNEAARDLQRSKELNQNRSLFRSQLLLDQDQAVRGANLAAIYRDAGMYDVSVREAGRAVNYDYANHSAHLFLANSYDAIRDPKLINLRYETAWFSELMLSRLLAPVGASSLSDNVSRQEYSRLFNKDRLGLFSSTTYASSGDWLLQDSIYGHAGRTGFAVDAYFRTENGQRPNNDLEQHGYHARVKQELTEKDSVFLQASYFDSDSGDLAQYYNQQGSLTNVAAPNEEVRVKEYQEPFLFGGYHRQWAPGLHTLFLAGAFNDQLQVKDGDPTLPRLQAPLFGGTPAPAPLTNPSLDYESDLRAYSTELQQIWQTAHQTFVVGARYQDGENDTDSRVTSGLNLPPLFTPTTDSQDFKTDLYRVGVYLYEQYQVFESLRLVGGVSYDKLHYAENIETAPISDSETSEEKWSPKAGLIWQPERNTYVRGAYTRSLGGVFFDTSVRLEPTQVAGFNQAFRSLIPESVSGLVPGTEFETGHAGVDHTFETGTYLGVEGQWLTSEGERQVGLYFDDDPFTPADTLTSFPQDLDYEEKTLLVTLNQLLARDFFFGARYRLTEAELETRYGGLGSLAFVDQDTSAVLHQVVLLLGLNHPSGLFGQVDSIWSQQSNHDYTPDIPGDDFWQFNVSGGYRFWRRRGEAAVGLLNITDEDYRLNPLTLYQELPHERTFVARLSLFF